MCVGGGGGVEGFFNLQGGGGVMVFLTSKGIEVFFVLQILSFYIPDYTAFLAFKHSSDHHTLNYTVWSH